MLRSSNPAFARYTDVLSVLTARHVKTRYRGSLLGVVWSLLNPAAMTLVYTAVFGHEFGRYYHDSTLYYMLAVFIGLTLNGFVAASSSQALRAVVDNGGLMNKVKTPASLYPTSLMLAGCFQLAVGAFPVLAITALIITRNPLNVAALLIPFASVVLLALGASYIMSALYVFFRDIPYMYELVMFAMWVATPVFYPLVIVGAKYRPFIELNPLTQAIETVRDLVFKNGPLTVFGVVEPLACGIILSVVGWVVFQALSPKFMDYL